MSLSIFLYFPLMASVIIILSSLKVIDIDPIFCFYMWISNFPENVPEKAFVKCIFLTALEESMIL